MGVTGLWSILQPCARPTKIETLNRKRLAVDASIWIYQFLKAVRDKEGNALRNSHVVGFFRRICKLLFFGIKPVFVFDGGAPALKRNVIRARKQRREGRRDDAVRTAGKLLAVQMQRRAEEEESRRKEAQDRRLDNEEEVPEEGVVYVDELFATPQERQESKTKFRRKDAYHLPALDVAMSEMTGPNDPRVMSLDELQDYARQFDRGEDINVYDFSKIDYDSPFFTSLPASDRYNILNAARLRSRLRMGHSKEQLDTMFPDRMAFSKFQIERVTERNELTQRLMHVNEGGAGSYDGSSRVAGEKGREYVLVKNDGVEGGWALGVVSNEGRSVNEAIDLDKAPVFKKEEESESEEDFEDVAIEGLNRLPKLKPPSNHAQSIIRRQRRALYRSRKRTSRRKPKPRVEDDPDSLFVAEEPAKDGSADDSGATDQEISGSDQEGDEEDDDLNRAITLSLQKDDAEDEAADLPVTPSDHDESNMLETFQQAAVSEALPIPKASGRSIANIVNQRAFKAAPESHEITSFGVPVPKPDLDAEVDDSVDLTAALAESRRTKRRAKTPPGPRYQNVQPHTPRRTAASVSPKKPKLNPEQSASDIAKAHGFKGPLPFESLDLGSSLLGKKKMQDHKSQAAGGFENPELADKNKKAEPLPPWFSGDLEKDIAKQRQVEDDDRQKAKEFNERFRFDKVHAPLQRHTTNEVIDLDGDDDAGHGPVFVDLELEVQDAAQRAGRVDMMDTVADEIRASPPISANHNQPRPTQVSQGPSPVNKPNPFSADSDEEDVQWSDSDEEKTTAVNVLREKSMEPVGGLLAEPEPAAEVETAQLSPPAPARSPSAEFEDVNIPDRPASPKVRVQLANAAPATLAAQDSIPEEFLDEFSDPEDEELMRSLAKEAEEHARFESTLNQKSVAQNIADYERELKQLRNQQKKDRRDADEVTHVMITECQQLLQLFGLPYITAPMEAEAQCAELVRLGLVDGIVTDDSDCFLFGGTRVYKNVFNQAKFVECYLASDLEKEFDLTRDKMIAAAQLLGSDYAEGLTGVGPVTALEILAEFGDLTRFKEWWIGVQNLTISKQDDAGSSFRKKFRKNATKIFLPPAFPDERVSMAYLAPEVDASAEQFQWGVPDLGALRAYLMATIGWSQERTDEILVPVIKDMNRRMDEGTQANITAFFEGGVGAGAAGRGQGGEAFAPRRKIDSSNRMGKAMTRLADKARSNRKRSVTEDEDGFDHENGAEGDHELRPMPEEDNSEPIVAAKPKAKRAKRSRVASK